MIDEFNDVMKASTKEKSEMYLEFFIVSFAEHYKPSSEFENWGERVHHIPLNMVDCLTEAPASHETIPRTLRMISFQPQ